MFKRGRARCIGARRSLRNGNVLDGLAVVRFVADIGCEVTGSRESAPKGKGREEPSRFGEQVVEGDRVRHAVRSRPGSYGRGRGEVTNFAALARGEAKVGTACSGSERFEHGCAGVIFGTSNASSGAGECDIGEWGLASQG